MRQAINIPNVQRIADLFAVSCSGLCAIHCLAAPSMLVLLPLLGASLLDDELFHAAILWLIVPASVAAVLMGCWRHKDRHVAILCLCGVVALLAAVRFGHEFLGEAGERVLTFAGSFLLIAGHFRNFSLCRRATCHS